MQNPQLFSRSVYNDDIYKTTTTKQKKKQIGQDRNALLQKFNQILNKLYKTPFYSVSALQIYTRLLSKIIVETYFSSISH